MAYKKAQRKQPKARRGAAGSGCGEGEDFPALPTAPGGPAPIPSTASWVAATATPLSPLSPVAAPTLAPVPVSAPALPPSPVFAAAKVSADVAPLVSVPAPAVAPTFAVAPVPVAVVDPFAVSLIARLHAAPALVPPRPVSPEDEDGTSPPFSVEGSEEGEAYYEGCAFSTSVSPPCPAIAGAGVRPAAACDELPEYFLDDAVLAACHQPKERKFLLKLELHIVANMKNDKIKWIKLTTPMSPYLRFLVHKVADYFGLQRIVDKEPIAAGEKQKAIMTLVKTDASRLPRKSLAQLCEEASQDSSRSTLPVTVPAPTVLSVPAALVQRPPQVAALVMPAAPPSPAATTPVAPPPPPPPPPPAPAPLVCTASASVVPPAASVPAVTIAARPRSTAVTVAGPVSGCLPTLNAAVGAAPCLSDGAGHAFGAAGVLGAAPADQARPRIVGLGSAANGPPAPLAPVSISACSSTLSPLQQQAGMLPVGLLRREPFPSPPESLVAGPLPPGAPRLGGLCSGAGSTGGCTSPIPLPGNGRPSPTKDGESSPDKTPVVTKPANPVFIPGQFKVMVRREKPNSDGEKSEDKNKDDNSKQDPSRMPLEEREKYYQEARARIFGESQAKVPTIEGSVADEGQQARGPGGIGGLGGLGGGGAAGVAPSSSGPGGSSAGDRGGGNSADDEGDHRRNHLERRLAHTKQQDLQDPDYSRGRMAYPRRVPSGPGSLQQQQQQQAAAVAAHNAALSAQAAAQQAMHQQAALHAAQVGMQCAQVGHMHGMQMDPVGPVQNMQLAQTQAMLAAQGMYPNMSHNSMNNVPAGPPPTWLSGPAQHGNCAVGCAGGYGSSSAGGCSAGCGGGGCSTGCGGGCCSGGSVGGYPGAGFAGGAGGGYAGGPGGYAGGCGGSCSSSSGGGYPGGCAAGCAGGCCGGGQSGHQMQKQAQAPQANYGGGAGCCGGGMRPNPGQFQGSNSAAYGMGYEVPRHAGGCMQHHGVMLQGGPYPYSG